MNLSVSPAQGDRKVWWKRVACDFISVDGVGRRGRSVWWDPTIRPPHDRRRLSLDDGG